MDRGWSRRVSGVLLLRSLVRLVHLEATADGTLESNTTWYSPVPGVSTHTIAIRDLLQSYKSYQERGSKSHGWNADGRIRLRYHPVQPHMRDSREFKRLIDL